ncbi:hypothetical protein NVP1193O_040 [Vibrio phage 1.193.O._10N.286.52.C6]|nr:hypothetical protein NVP1193O_040 [Vibrio phage 1.193.O._10N.286.52.C6]
MEDLSKIDIELDCSMINQVSSWGGNKLSVSLDSADMTAFVNDHQEEILDWIDVDEVGKWLDSKGYRVEEE